MSASIEQIWNIVASRPKFVFSPTFIFCSPICPNNCGVFFCEKIFYFSRNDIFRSAAQICKFSPWILPELWKKYHFSKNAIYFHKKTTPQLFGHIGLQNMKVGEKTNLGDLPLFVWCMLTLALKNAQMFLLTLYVKSHSGFCPISNVIMWDTFVLAIVLRSIDVIESILTVAVLA